MSVEWADLPGTALVDGDLARRLLSQLVSHGVPRNRIATDVLGWTSWPGDEQWPGRRVCLRLVRALEAALTEVTTPVCEECGDEPLAGGRWCLPCFQAHANPEVRPRGCGTDAGHRAHYRRGEKPCEACRRAHAVRAAS